MYFIEKLTIFDIHFSGICNTLENFRVEDLFLKHLEGPPPTIFTVS